MVKPSGAGQPKPLLWVGSSKRGLERLPSGSAAADRRRFMGSPDRPQGTLRQAAPRVRRVPACWRS